MNAEFFEALAMLEKERGLTADYLIERISNAIVIAVKKDYEVEDDRASSMCPWCGTWWKRWRTPTPR